ncbi:MAG TPA: tRNA uracil 4-sulfurtransferase ThiI [Methanotrichaceae archaeon]|nr:tRNA uracil 4-sulfurtransferase ThiI [Methanotrichaceae archaeon]
MISSDVVLVRYGEITLKDRWTRSNWEHILAANISNDLRLAGLDYRITRAGGRIFVHTADPRAAGIISRIFGVVSASPAITARPDIAEISRLAVEVASQFSPSSFAIRPRRSSGDISSEELGVVIGTAAVEALGIEVDLEDPDLEIFIEARSDRAYIFTEVIKGVGGLPLGSQARMLALISGGIDSPVAAWMMMKRGCTVSLLHFDAKPYADAASASRRAAEALAEWTSGRKIRFIQVPMSRGIEKIASNNPRATCILCRRLMYLVASEVMRFENASGIVTGYSMGQVASQTAENIMAEQAGIDGPIYHPLIALDKSEITDLARKIGTLQITEETRSCTAVPDKPLTRAKLDEILALEAELGLKELAKEIVGEMSVVRI